MVERRPYPEWQTVTDHLREPGYRDYWKAARHLCGVRFGGPRRLGTSCYPRSDSPNDRLVVNQAALEIRLLGQLEVVRDGEPLDFPPSRKARALLAYLVATSRPHPREQLCDLLWQGPRDPRASLRWSLSKIRPLVDEPNTERLVTGAGRVGFAPKGAKVDLYRFREAAAGAANLSTETLTEVADLWRGDFLEGLNLSGCPRFEVWCTGEREKVRRSQERLLGALINRLSDRPEQALPHARMRLASRPFSEEAHAAVVRLLGRAGRREEAREQYEVSRKVLREELNHGALPELEEARRAAGSAPSADQEAALVDRAEPGPAGGEAITPTRPRFAPSDEVPLVGREAERDLLAEVAAGAAQGGACDLLLVTGALGIGKTRLLEELAAIVRDDDGEVLPGRAFQAEMIRPYGAWIEALRAIPTNEVPADLRPELAALLPELGAPPPEEGDRNRLFDAVVALLEHRAAARTVAVLLDDVHWLDEASCALLHFVARHVTESGVLLACGARDADLEESAPARRLLGSLDRVGNLRRLSLSPLGEEATARLAGSVSTEIDPAEVFTESEGNPLFTLEITRARASGIEALPSGLKELLGERLASVGPRGRDVLPWAAALGREFDAAVLARVSDLPTAQLLKGVEELERRGVLRATGGGACDFSHALLRRAAYRRLSDPQRRLVHLRIARSLATGEELDAELAGEVAYHAAEGGDPGLAARACVVAARRCLGVFAYEEAAALAARGLDVVEDLDGAEELGLRIDVLEIYARPVMADHRPPELEADIVEAVGEARRLGLDAELQRTFYLIGSLRYQSGDVGKALDSILQAEEVGREADPGTVVQALADTAHCLAMLGQRLDRAEEVALEARRLAGDRAGEPPEIPLALGLVRRHQGRWEEAVPLLERAARGERRRGERWWECFARSQLCMIDLERGEPHRALSRCERLLPLARKLGEGSQAPFVMALAALARRDLEDGAAEERLHLALERLRRLDSRWMIAFVQTTAAEGDLEAGRLDAARRRGEEALEAASVVHRHDDMALARALLARIAFEEGDRQRGERHALDAGNALEASSSPAARARTALESLEGIRMGIETPAS